MTNSLEPSASSSFSGPEAAAALTAWRWRFEDTAGTEVDGSGVPTAEAVAGFPSQSDAESWIGETWADLLDEGVDQVTLFEADRRVYGPMSLHATA